jgi:arylsulfatase
MRLKVLILALTLGLTPHGMLFAAARPDIVLIMVDDMGFSDIGAYGSEIETPNLDRLAAGGLRFRQFYNTAKCAQTRATLLSGRYYPEVTFTGAHKNSVTLAETLRAAGYKTLMSGKWHLIGEPTQQGFDRYFGHLAGSINSFTGEASHGEETFRLDGQPWKVPADGFYSTDAVTDYAIRFLDEEARSEKEPFFLYIAYNAPHYPLQAKRADVEKYLGRYNIGWDELRRRRFARQVELAIIPPSTELSPRPDEVPAWDSLIPEQRREHELTMAAFAAMIDSVDQNIGRLIAHLKAMGRFENTLFVFLSDNGGCPFQRTREETRSQWLMPWDPESYWTYDEGWAHASNTPFRWYKQNQHEGGISSPFIVHWPAGLKGNGRIVDGPGHLIDVAATFYDVAAAKYPRKFSGTAIAPLRGRSLLPILKGESDGDPREIWQFYRDNRALRQGDWKIASVRDVDRWELFHLSEDRSEVNDLSGKYPARRAAMIKRYEALDAEIRSHASPEPAADDKMR